MLSSPRLLGPLCALTAVVTPAVVVAGRRVSIKIDGGGTTTWANGELERIVRDFRG